MELKRGEPPKELSPLAGPQLPKDPRLMAKVQLRQDKVRMDRNDGADGSVNHAFSPRTQ